MLPIMLVIDHDDDGTQLAELPRLLLKRITHELEPAVTTYSRLGTCTGPRDEDGMRCDAMQCDAM